MSATRQILDLIRNGEDGVTAASLEEALGFSRQYTVRLLNRLIAAGEIHRRGKTRAARYHLGKASEEIDRLELIKEREGLSEHVVFEEVIKRMRLTTRLNRNCIAIFDYAFTEMLNNAIDHSHSKKVWVRVEVDHSVVTFVVKDLGIGAIESIKQGFDIGDDFSVIVSEDGIYGVGNGAKWAMGALHAGASVQEALEIAAKKDIYTSGPFQIVKQQKSKNIK